MCSTRNISGYGNVHLRRKRKKHESTPDLPEIHCTHKIRNNYAILFRISIHEIKYQVCVAERYDIQTVFNEYYIFHKV